jgi:hypothetical protein
LVHIFLTVYCIYHGSFHVLKSEAKRIDGVLDNDVKMILKNIQMIDYAFEELQIGGAKNITRKMRKRKTRMNKTRHLFMTK